MSPTAGTNAGPATATARRPGATLAGCRSYRADSCDLLLAATPRALPLGGAIACLLALRIGVGWVLPAVTFVAVLGVVLSRIDIATRRLPFAITLPALAVTALLLVPASVIDGAHLAGQAAGSAIAWLAVYAAIAVVTRGRGMGWGDVVLAPTLGLTLGALGPGPSVVGLASGFLLAATVAVGLIVRGAVARHSSIPFGPFMLAGAAIGAVAGNDLLAFALGSPG